MAGSRPGPARKPNLQVVREGNPDHRTRAELDRGLKVRPEAPAEPDWREWFPVVQKGDAKPVNEKARRDARAVWQRVVPVLDASGVLSTLDLDLLTDVCVTVVRLRQCERDISISGLRLEGDRGQVRNPNVVSAKQYRDQLRYLAGQLGLSPVERDYLQPPGPADPEAQDGKPSAFDV